MILTLAKWGLVGIRMALRFAGQLLVQKHVLVQNFQREIFTMAFTGEVFAVVLAQKKKPWFVHHCRCRWLRYNKIFIMAFTKKIFAVACTKEFVIFAFKQRIFNIALTETLATQFSQWFLQRRRSLLSGSFTKTAFIIACAREIFTSVFT
jgi:hypothetical protein